MRAAVLRGFVKRFELTSPMVKLMMLDAADEIERLRAERDDWRDTAEDGAKMMRAEIERLDTIIVELIILAREHGIGEKKIREIVEMEQSGRKSQNRRKPQSDQ